MVYSKKSEVQGMLTGNETTAGLGFDRFHWFEARERHARASLAEFVPKLLLLSCVAVVCVSFIVSVQGVECNRHVVELPPKCANEVL